MKIAGGILLIFASFQSLSVVAWPTRGAQKPKLTMLVWGMGYLAVGVELLV